MKASDLQNGMHIALGNPEKDYKLTEAYVYRAKERWQWEGEKPVQVTKGGLVPILVRNFKLFGLGPDLVAESVRYVWEASLIRPRDITGTWEEVNERFRARTARHAQIKRTQKRLQETLKIKGINIRYCQSRERFEISLTEQQVLKLIEERS